MSREKKIQLLHYLSAALLAVILVCQFTPFWTYSTADGETFASISTYIWFPTENQTLDSYISSAAGEDVNALVLPAVLVLILSSVGCVMCLYKHGNAWVGLLPLGCGLAGLWGFLCKAGFQLGTCWGLHVILYAAALIVGALAMYYSLHAEKAA